jgi:hypothetical protein
MEDQDQVHSNREVAMAVAPLRNESNLMQRTAGRPTLEQMRSRLASSKPESAVAPKVPKPKTAGSGTWVWVAIIGGLLVSANFLLYMQKERLMDKLGFQRVLSPLAPAAELSAEDKILFWAYAAYAPEKLGARFHVPSDAVIDPEDARHHLAALMAKEAKGVSPATQAEILTLEKKPGEERTETTQ